MDRIKRIARPLLFIILCAAWTVAAGAQAELADYWERADNERQPPEQVMDALGLKPGMVIGEVGAGRGRYTVHLASRVGPTGKVYAEDINDGSLDYLRGRLKRAGLSNTEVILGEVDDPLFPKDSLDMVLMVLTYHHLARPIDLLRNLIPALKPGAIVAVLDPDPKKDPGMPESEYTPRSKIREEARRAGFELVRVENFLPKDNLFILRLKTNSSS
jgi:ubiquinone/menaquinone biosynthesis C-methylase UbiE